MGEDVRLVQKVERAMTAQGLNSDVRVRRLADNVLLRLDPDGTVVFDTDFFDALVRRIVERMAALEPERRRE